MVIFAFFPKCELFAFRDKNILKKGVNIVNNKSLRAFTYTQLLPLRVYSLILYKKTFSTFIEGHSKWKQKTVFSSYFRGEVNFQLNVYSDERREKITFELK